jgi:hypothetical protein
MCYSILGIPMYLISVAKIGRLTTRILKRVYRFLTCKKTIQQTKIETISKKVQENIMPKLSISNTSDDVDDDDDDDDTHIPIVVTITVIVCYVVIGTFIFNALEKWPLVNSSYYSFITLSSIGFGDFVAGLNLAPSLLMCIIYTYLGIALLTMCFKLIINEIKRIKRIIIGRRITTF